MNIIGKNFLIGLTVLGLSSTSFMVQAHPAEGHRTHSGQHAKNPAKAGERAEKRQAKLHEALKLNASQEAAWTAYRATARPQPKARAERVALAALPAPERMEKRIALSKQRIASKEARLPALNAFYAVLSPEQKKVFDESTQRRGQRRHHGHDGHHGHHGAAAKLGS